MKAYGILAAALAMLASSVAAQTNPCQDACDVAFVECFTQTSNFEECERLRSTWPTLRCPTLFISAMG